MSRKINKKSGIYKIINSINSKFYIGSSVDIYSRWKTHKHQLRNNKHHNIHLQRSWNKYGEENFVFVLVEECLKEQTIEIEQKYLDNLNVKNNIDCFNISSTADKPMLGKKLSEETLKKISGENHHNYGKKHSEKTKKKMSDNSPKIWLGKKHSEKTKKKMSEQRIGIKHPRSRYTDIDIKMILIMSKIVKSRTKIGKILNLPRTLISDVLTGRSWSHIIF